MRRNGAPTMAAIVTTVLTVILIGVLIPIFQTTQTKSTEVRDSLELRVSLYDDATKAKSPSCSKIEAMPHVESVASSASRGAGGIQEGPRQEKAEELTQAAERQPAARQLLVKPDDAGNLDADRAVARRRARTASRSRSRRSSRKIFDRQDRREEDRAGDRRAEDRPDRDHRAADRASLMLVGNTIRLSIYTRRREVEVMRLVGATRWFIRWPFMIEGVVVGFAGGLIAILILWLGKITIVDPLSSTFSLPAAQNNSTISFRADGDPLRRRGDGLGDRLRRHPAPLPEGLSAAMSGGADRGPGGSRSSLVLCAGIWLGGHPGQPADIPPRRLRRRQRRAQPSKRPN